MTHQAYQDDGAISDVINKQPGWDRQQKGQNDRISRSTMANEIDPQ
jgi:hypothetical protein